MPDDGEVFGILEREPFNKTREWILAQSRWYWGFLIYTKLEKSGAVKIVYKLPPNRDFTPPRLT